MSSHRTVSCDELHALVSCRLDGAVSQFEAALATAHLRECAACARYDAEVGAFTRLLREAVLEAPPEPVRVAYGGRYRRPMRMARGAVATAAVAMAAVAISGSVPLSETPAVVRAAVAPPNDTVRTAAPAVGTIARNRLVTLQELLRDDLSAGLVPVVSERRPDTLGAVKPALRAGNV